ncbi:MAG: hypothetical protein NTV72_00305 [Candidatus Taylorbacteria bacterium]|nr:hypothetical protein [Candidatus Taylorbacteria bacterium]
MENNISPEIKEYINSVDFDDKIASIPTKYSLHIDQVGQFVGIVKSFLFGNIKRDRLIGEVAGNLEIDEKLAGELVNTFNTEVLMPLREKMRSSLENQNTNENPAQINTSPQTTQESSLVIPSAPTTSSTLSSVPNVPNLLDQGLQGTLTTVKKIDVPPPQNSYTSDPYREPIK